MRRNKVNTITLVPSNLVSSTGGSVNVSLSREFAEADATDPSGEAVYSRDTLDATITKPEIVAAAKNLGELIAQHLANELKTPTKFDTRRDAPLAMPDAAPTAPEIVR